MTDRNSCTVANGGASVPEVLAPAKLEGIFAVVVVPHVLEPAHRPAVGNDEEKAQKLSMHPPRGRHDAGQEGTGDTSAVGVALTASFLYSMNHELIERLSWLSLIHI